MSRPDPTDPIDLTRALIACPSVTPDEGGALDLLQGVLERLGFTVTRLPFGPGDGSEPTIDNLWAVLGAGGPHLCFAGHTDVVPPGDPALWTHPPFAGAVADGFLWGRGACDMKGAIGAFVAALGTRRAAGWQPAGTVSLLITGDEEGPARYGTVKVRDWLKDRGITLDACLVGEPSCVARLGDTIKVGRRGSLNARLRVEGVQGHAAYPHLADNPLERLVRLLAALTEAPLDRGSELFEPSTLALTSIDTGNPASNVIPAATEARFNVRFNDLHTSASVERALRARLDAAGGRYTLAVSVTGESFFTPPGPFFRLVAEAVAAETGIDPEPSTGGGTSDARFLREICPVLEFGLVNATIHQVDERVALADLARLTGAYGRILDGFFAGGR